MKRKKPRPTTGPNRQRYHVSVGRETYRAIQAAAIARGVSLTSVVEEACKCVGCADCVAGVF